MEPKFDQKQPWSLAYKGESPFIAQGNALFSYAEPKGAWDNEIKGKPLDPEPKFMMYAEEWDLTEKKEKYDKLRVQAFSVSETLANLEKELKAEGVLDDTS